LFGWPNQQAVQTENKIQHMMIEKETFVNVADNLTNDQLQVSDCYPNPSSTSFYVDIHLLQQTEVLVTIPNITGQEVKAFQVPGMKSGKNRVSVDVSDLSPGFYQCTFKAEGNVTSCPIIVQR
jgi:hypothetical protein